MTATEPRVEQISAESDTELSTRTQQMRFLVENSLRLLGKQLTRRGAHALLRSWELDLADERREQAFRERLGNDEHLPREVFLRYLMAAPDYRKPHIRKWQVGEGGGWGTR